MCDVVKWHRIGREPINEVSSEEGEDDDDGSLDDVVVDDEVGAMAECHIVSRIIAIVSACCLVKDRRTVGTHQR
jgi:hypothetical protein